VQNRALEGALLLAIPAAVALVLLALPIVSVLFEHGAFSAADAQGAAGCLAAFAPGLVAAAAARVMAQPFLARENIRVPLLSAAATLVVTWAAAVMLEPTWGVAGIAAGVTLGAFAGAGALALVLAVGDLWTPDARLRHRLPRTAAASAVMAVVLLGLLPLAAPWLDAAVPPLVRAVALGALCIAGLAIFAASAVAFGAVTRADLTRSG
jgi:putative peptidoglycan lipid II flippase